MFERNSLIAAVLLMVAVAPVRAVDEKLAVDDADRALVASLYRSPVIRGPKMDKARHYRHPDGVRGVTIFTQPEPPPVSGEMDPTHETLHRFACNYALFGVAELQDAKSFVGKDEFDIFTKLRFKLVESWSVRPGSKVQSFDLLVQGGEVERNGETLRLGNPQAAYVKGRQYLMIMHSAQDSNSNIFVGAPYLLEISNGSIYPESGWSPFKSGTTLTRAKAMVHEALDQKVCE